MNTESIHENNASQTTGHRLRTAREQMGLSQQAVAERLCLKLSTVRNIEEDSVPADLAATFLRGYIRSYARLVRISDEDLLSIMDEQVPLKAAKVQPMQSFSLGKRRKKRDGWLMSFTWLILLIVIGLTGAWWWQNHKAQQNEYTSMLEQKPVESTTKGTRSIPMETGANQVSAQNTDQPLALADDANANALSQPTAAINAQTAAPVSADPVAVSPSQPGVGNPDMTAASPSALPDRTGQLPTDTAMAMTTTDTDPNALVMNFTGDCWLEVSDATGKKLFSGMQRNGGSLSLSGQLPYTLKIGAPAAVQAQFQGKPVDLSHFIRTSQVARLTLKGKDTAPTVVH